METMKIAAIHGKQQARLVDVPIPEPKEDWVLVKIQAIPMCTEYQNWLSGRQVQGMGHEAAGEIVAVGPGALNTDGKRNPIDVKVGDKVLFSKYSGDEVKIDGQDLIIIKEEDVIVILN